MPSAVGYQPNLNTEIGELQERITSTKSGSITSVQAIYVPADDYTDPAPAATFAHLDATTNLSRQIVERGIYPAVDPLASSSRILDPRIVGAEHYAVARGVKSVLQRYKSCRTSSRFSVSKSFPMMTSVRWPRSQDRRFLSQPMFVAAQFTASKASTSRSKTPCAASRKSWKQVRRHARASVLHGRDDRRSAGEG